MNFAKTKTSQKSSSADIRLGSKYTLTSGGYWWVKVKQKKGKKIKVINSNLEMSRKKFLTVFRGAFRTQSKIYEEDFSGK